MSEAFIVDAVRTPRSRRKGRFSGVHPVDLLTYPLNALIQRNKIDPALVEDVVTGCVTQTGEQGWCVARASVLAAGWPITVPATTINRLCGSGQQAFNFVAGSVKSSQYGLAVAAGLEHMTRAPMFSDISGEVSPLLQRNHPDLVQQGMAAELLAEEFKVSRAEMDHFALQSQLRAQRAQEAGYFRGSLVPVPYKDETGKDCTLEVDDNPRHGSTLEGLAKLRPVFKDDGFITAGNASAIVDGAGAILLASEEKVRELSFNPRARVVSQAVVGSPPRIMLTGPIAASELALKRAKLTKDQIDVWEINEAFAVVPIVAIRGLGISIEKVNVNGGGIALGHPLGATGVMLLNTALDELERSNGRYALVTMCIGLGMGIATVIERV